MAVFLKKFNQELSFAIDEHYYKQIHRYHKQKLDKLLAESELVPQIYLDNQSFER